MSEGRIGLTRAREKKGMAFLPLHRLSPRPDGHRHGPGDGWAGIGRYIPRAIGLPSHGTALTRPAARPADR
ncbi:hypothetical protein Scel_04770 [Streptomyces cellostaticus]|nr:hypothetical protein Scel_04770 [Streptomyces cellostaticus]